MKRAYQFIFGITIILTSGILISAGISNSCPVVASVYLEKQNVLYSGVDNPITVTVAGIPPSSIVLSASDCDIRSTNKPGGFILKTKGRNSIDLLVKYVENGDTNSAGVFNYRVKRIPDPVAYVNDIRNEGVVLKNNLQNIMGVFTRMENFDFDFNFKPQSFTMSVYHDSTWIDYKAVGPSCTAEMKAALHDAMPEDKIIFHEVVTMGLDSSIRKVNPVFITVK